MTGSAATTTASARRVRAARDVDLARPHGRRPGRRTRSRRRQPRRERRRERAHPSCGHADVAAGEAAQHERGEPARRRQLALLQHALEERAEEVLDRVARRHRAAAASPAAPRPARRGCGRRAGARPRRGRRRAALGRAAEPVALSSPAAPARHLARIGDEVQPGRVAQQRAAHERAQVEAAGHADALQLGIRGVQHLEPAVDREAVDTVGPHPAAGASDASSTRTERPAAVMRSAAESPARPAPTTRTSASRSVMAR